MAPVGVGGYAIIEAVSVISLVVAAQVVVRTLVGLAGYYDISESVIGLTVLSLGTLIGSNITNPLLGIGLGSALSTYFVPLPLVYWDLPMETVTAAILLIYLLIKNDLGKALAGVAGRLGLDRTAGRLSTVRERHLGRVGAVLLIALYILYLVVRIVYFPDDF